MHGCFITFEGGEGAGKSTQINALAEYLRKKDYEVIVTREPGGTAGSEAVRYVLLSGYAEKYGAIIESVLFAGARADHVSELIAPALKAGKIVLCDRYIDSTRVYQGNGFSDSENYISLLEKTAILNCKPDLTFILNIPAEIGMQRAEKRRAALSIVDRFEKDTIDIQEQRRTAFLAIAESEPKRCRVINAHKSINDITREITKICDEFLNNGNTSKHGNAETI